MKKLLSILAGILVGAAAQAGVLIAFETATFQQSDDLKIGFRENVRDIPLQGRITSLQTVFGDSVVYTNAATNQLSVAFFDESQFVRITPGTLNALFNRWRNRGVEYVEQTETPGIFLRLRGWARDRDP